MTTRLPKTYAWLADEPGPRLLTEFLKVYGVQEDVSKEGSNPTIMSWANAIGFNHKYSDDSVAWCGLAMGYVAGQAGWDFSPLGNPLWALNWRVWGHASDVPMLGDVLVFTRKEGGHVGVYAGEDEEAFHVLGGNQDDSVKIKPIAKSRLVASRRCPWRINQPANVRRIFLKSTGDLSTNEA